jgi:CHASE3 domain sensor protein
MEDSRKMSNSLIRKVAEIKAETKKAIVEKAGQQAADNMGWIALIVVVILVVLTFSVPAIRDGFLPSLVQKFNQIFSFHA